MAEQKTGKQAQNAASALDVIEIRWVDTIYSKFRGNKTVSTYADPKTKKVIILIDTTNGVEKPFTFLASKSKFKFEMTNQWHKDVYNFLVGLTFDKKANPDGSWRGHPFLNPEKKVFKIVNVSAEAKSRNLNRKEQDEMKKQIREMGDEELIQFGILFGADGAGFSYDEVLDAIFTIIETVQKPGGERLAFTSRDVKDMLDNPDYDYILLTAVCLKAGVFKFDGSVYRYNQSTIGVTEGQITKWLKDNSPVFQMLKETHLAKKEVEEIADVKV